MSLIRAEAVFRPMIFLIPSLSAVAIIWYGGKLVATGTGPDAFTIGQLTAFMFCLTQLVWPMVALGWVFNIAQRASASAARIQTIFDHPHEITDGAETDHGITSLTGDIELRDVALRYTDDGPDVLAGISLKIPAGNTCAIIGRTGSGKSSLVGLLPRFRETTGGQLLLDGHPITQIPLSVLRGSIGFATQEAFLFSDTLFNNIAFAKPDASAAEVERAAEIAGFARDVAGFPGAYQARVGERGMTLSGGQKQRCALARALVADPRILILDDTFSAVDTDTEEEILRGLREFMKGRTTILISHRISTVRAADRILVLDEGRIIETGTHAELVALGGLYSEFERKQRLASEIEDF
jgi:ATP-binding cassette subfamily B multidrug efflux pump